MLGRLQVLVLWFYNYFHNFAVFENSFIGNFPVTVKLLIFSVALIVFVVYFGVGFAVAGYCPGTCLVAAGEGKTDAIVTILGGLAGVFIYALVYPAISGLIGVANYGEVTIPSALGINGIWIAIPFSAILFVLMFKVLKDRYE